MSAFSMGSFDNQRAAYSPYYFDRSAQRMGPSVTPVSRASAGPVRNGGGGGMSPYAETGEMPGAPSNPARGASLENDFRGQANQYATNAFGQHWENLTKGLDTANNADVEKLAQAHKVSRGQVSDPTGQYHVMNNEELLAAVKSRAKESFMQGVQSDPRYKNMLGGMDVTQGPTAARRLGMTPYDVGMQQAQVTGAQNTAAAIPVQAQAAADTAQGHLLTGQAANTEAGAKVPLYAAEARQKDADAQRTTAMTPYDTGYRQAQTGELNAQAAAIPAKTAQAVAQADQAARVKESQIALNKSRATAATQPKSQFGGILDAPQASQADAAGALPKAPTPGAKLIRGQHDEIAKQFLDAAGGDLERARQLAKQYGWSL